MARYPRINDDEEGEEEERQITFKRRRGMRSSRIVLEDEEEFVDRVKLVVAAAQNQQKPLHAVLSDIEVFDCPICLHQLLPPIFQCENGHIVCSSCCSKLKNKCPFRCKLIGSRCRGLEKLLESISILCTYAKNGCDKTTLYTKKRDHEEMCCHVTCFCPHPSCSFGSSTLYLYSHFTHVHEDCTTRFTYNTAFSVSIDIHQKQLFLQEQIGSPVFILNHDVQEHGRTFYLVCVGLSTLKNKFAYQLTAESMDASLSLKSVPMIYKNWVKDTPIENYLTVPSEFADDSGLLSLSVCIHKRVLPDLEMEEDQQNWNHDPNAYRCLTVVLRDPFVLDCSICLELLWHPIFQCENGHLACSSCCSKLKNRCSCGYSYNRCRGLEKVTESVNVISCKNAKNGCKFTMPYRKRSKHDNECVHDTCFCPHPSCPFASSYENLYLHFGNQHAAFITRFTYDTTFSVCVDINQKHIFLQEQKESMIFILNHEVLEHGRAFYVDRVGSRALSNSYVYQLTAKSMETFQTLKSVPEIYTKGSKQSPNKNFLTVPSEFVGHSGLVSLSVCISRGY